MSHQTVYFSGRYFGLSTLLSSRQLMMPRNVERNGEDHVCEKSLKNKFKHFSRLFLNT